MVNTNVQMIGICGGTKSFQQRSLCRRDIAKVLENDFSFQILSQLPQIFEIGATVYMAKMP